MARSIVGQLRRPASRLRPGACFHHQGDLLTRRGLPRQGKRDAGAGLAGFRAIGGNPDRAVTVLAELTIAAAGNRPQAAGAAYARSLSWSFSR